MAEYDNAGVRSKRYAYLPGSYLAAQVEDGNGIYEVHGDHLQTPRALTDASKSVVWESTHEGFGKAYVTEDVDGDSNDVVFNMGFPGQYRDGESGLVYNWNRYYDAGTGRYISSEPIRLDGLMRVLGRDVFYAADSNLYGYVGSDPLGWMDLDGFGKKKGGKLMRNASDLLDNGMCALWPASCTFKCVKWRCTEKEKCGERERVWYIERYNPSPAVSSPGYNPDHDDRCVCIDNELNR